MRKRRALAVAFATVLAALTAGAATHPAALQRVTRAVRAAAAASGGRLIERAQSGRVHVLHTGDVRALAAAVPRLEAPVSNTNEIDLPGLTIRGDAPARAAKSAPIARARCQPEWRSLDIGPTGRRVRPLCPAELEGSVAPAAAAATKPAENPARGLLRLDVPHPFLNDHLVDLKPPVP